ncbi:Ig-like domain-containing protein, partial [Candidatus Poribacteria bacterium]|nr:Ig-like domain-containing protein [Candidatus Poribacteria bacterium]
MSSKQLVYLFMVLVVCCSVAGGIAHGQSTGTVTFKGTVLIDDSPAPGITITGANSAGIAGLIGSAESREDGSYTYGWLSFSGVVSAGDTFTFTLTDSEGNSQETAPYTLTAADTAVPFTVDLDLVPVSAGITVQSGLSAIPADGTSTSTITAMVRDDSGNPTAGDTVTISADKGTVGTTTDNGDGTYSATYTAPSLALAATDTAQISAASAQLGETAMTSITLTPVPTTVTVTVEPNIFSADTPGDGMVTISVDRAGPVADETVTISAPSIGTIGAVTNNGDGTYSATYTSGGLAGRVTLTATATQANESASAIITINAGSPATVTVSAVPTELSSTGSSTITAMVSDSSGNEVGGQSLIASTSSGGTVTAFTESATRFGSYSATYTAPVVDAEGTETITVTVGTISGETTLQLTPVPPVEVSILNVEGTVFIADGETAAAGVDVEIMVGSNTAMATTDADGYFVTFLDLLAPVARGGDPVSIVVTDANDGTHGPYTSVLSNDELGEGGTATVRRDVTTAIPVPPRSVNVLVVNGVVYTIDGETPAEGVSVVVTVGSNALPMTTTDTNGFFERTAVGL